MMRRLINKIDTAIAKVSLYLKTTPSIDELDFYEELKAYLPSMNKVVMCARKRWIDNKEVAVSEKVFSIFEPHSELIQRGRREKPIEFGHKIVLNQTKDKFITSYEVLERNLSDRDLLEFVIRRHEEQFGKKPIALAADKGFCPDSDTFNELYEEIDYLEVPRSIQDYSSPLLSSAQQFRAGIEGSISFLKRCFRLSRCFFKGFKNFSSAVGSAIFCHNLTVLCRDSG